MKIVVALPMELCFQIFLQGNGVVLSYLQPSRKKEDVTLNIIKSRWISPALIERLEKIFFNKKFAYSRALVLQFHTSLRMPQTQNHFNRRRSYNRALIITISSMYKSG